MNKKLKQSVFYNLNVLEVSLFNLVAIEARISEEQEFELEEIFVHEYPFTEDLITIHKLVEKWKEDVEDRLK